MVMAEYRQVDPKIWLALVYVSLYSSISQAFLVACPATSSVTDLTVSVSVSTLKESESSRKLGGRHRHIKKLLSRWNFCEEIKFEKITLIVMGKMLE